jgi:MerR family transcriptional regulator/heat shock protein HspR
MTFHGFGGPTVGLPLGADADTPIFVISVASQLSGLHAQTLRTYDRLGLVSPGRTTGGGRRYSSRDIAVLREIQRLSQVEGVNLAGIKRIIELENQVGALQAKVTELTEQLHAAFTAADQRVAAANASHRNDIVSLRSQETSIIIWQQP